MAFTTLQEKRKNKTKASKKEKQRNKCENNLKTTYRKTNYCKKGKFFDEIALEINAVSSDAKNVGSSFFLPSCSPLTTSPLYVGALIVLSLFLYLVYGLALHIAIDDTLPVLGSVAECHPEVPRICYVKLRSRVLWQAVIGPIYSSYVPLLKCCLSQTYFCFGMLCGRPQFSKTQIHTWMQN